jgi:hypothetical protein
MNFGVRVDDDLRATGDEAKKLTRRVIAIGSMFFFWCGLRAVMGAILIFHELGSHPGETEKWIEVVLMVVMWASASFLGWLVKTQASRAAARLLLLLPVAFSIFVFAGRNITSQSTVIWGVLFVVVYAAGAIEAVRVTDRIHKLPGISLVL